MGTHNLLLAPGPSAYLEVISPDPKAARWDDHDGSIWTRNFGATRSAE
jgi:hypothetical protein